MGERFIYEDGALLSLSHAYLFIQNLANSGLRNFMKLITRTPGFLEESFSPTSIRENPGSTGAYSVGLKTGTVVFPNGEFFSSDGFICYVDLFKSPARQYIKLSHTDLRRTSQSHAFDSTDKYSEIIDGVKVTFSTSREEAVDGSELLVAQVDFFPDMASPEAVDLRANAVLNWNFENILNPQEIVSFSPSITSSRALFDSSISPDINVEYSNILSTSTDERGKFALDTIIYNDEFTFLEQVAYPYLTTAGEEEHAQNVMQGFSGAIGGRFSDASRPGISTDWDEEDIAIVSYDEWEEITNITTTVGEHPYLPFVRVKIHADNISNHPIGHYVNIWVSSAAIDTTLPPTRVMWLPKEGDSQPYILIPTEESDTTYYRIEVISPENEIVYDESGEASRDDESLAYLTVNTPLGADRRNHITGGHGRPSPTTHGSVEGNTPSTYSGGQMWPDSLSGMDEVWVSGGNAEIWLEDYTDRLHPPSRFSPGCNIYIVRGENADPYSPMDSDINERFMVRSLVYASGEDMPRWKIEFDSAGEDTDGLGPGARDWVYCYLYAAHPMKRKQLDDNGQALFYGHTPCASFYLPRFGEEGETRTLKQIEFVNTATYDDDLYEYTNCSYESTSGRCVIDTGETTPLPFFEGALITISSDGGGYITGGTEDYRVDLIWKESTYQIQIHIDDSGFQLSNTCDISYQEVDAKPVASISLREPNGDIHTDLGNIEQPSSGTFRVVFSTDIELAEGQWYDILLEDVTGTQEYMQADGYFRFYFEKE